jgi:hypothetical protein
MHLVDGVSQHTTHQAVSHLSFVKGCIFRGVRPHHGQTGCGPFVVVSTLLATPRACADGEGNPPGCVCVLCACCSYSWVGNMGMQPDPFVFFGMQPTTALNSSSSGRRLLDAAAEESAAGTGATCSATATDGSEEQQGQQCVEPAHEGSAGQQQSQQRRSLLAAAATLPVQGTVSVKEDPASYPSADVDAARGDGSVYLDDNGEITITGNIPDSVQVRGAPGGWRLGGLREGGGMGGIRAGYVCHGVLRVVGGSTQVQSHAWSRSTL